MDPAAWITVVRRCCGATLKQWASLMLSKAPMAVFLSLRHTFLTLGGRAGIDLRTLQELAGHSKPELTARYSHRRLPDLSDAVGKLPNFLSEPSSSVCRKRPVK